MRKMLYLLYITICIALSCCKVTHAPVSSITKGTLDKAIEGWCSNLCDYPKSLDEFVSYAEEHDSWKKRTIKDSLQTTLSFLKEEEEHIVWQFNHPTVTTMSLTILYYDDTIFRKTDKLSFSGLDVSLYSYNWYHLEYPNSIEELIAYDSLSHCQHQGFYRCCDATFDYLLKNKEKVKWRKGDGDILVCSGNDTIAFQGDDPRIAYCDEFTISNKVIFRFFDTSGRYAHSEELERALKAGLKQLQEKHFPTQDEQTVWHILVYTSKNGLQLFCNNGDIRLDTEWYEEVEAFLCQFCSEYGLGKVVFAVPEYNK